MVKAVIAIASFAAIVLTSFLYEEPLFELSKDSLIPGIQKDESIGSQKTWNYFSDACLGLIPVVPILCCYCCLQQRARTLYYVLVLTFALLLTNVLKLSNNDARPFWDSDKVQPFKCSM